MATGHFIVDLHLDIDLDLYIDQLEMEYGAGSYVQDQGNGKCKATRPTRRGPYGSEAVFELFGTLAKLPGLVNVYKKRTGKIHHAI